MIKKAFIVLSVMMFGGLGLAVASPSQAFADSAADAKAMDKLLEKCEKSMFLIPPWYRGLVEVKDDGGCEIKAVGDKGANSVPLSTFIWTVGLNILQAALVVAAYVALGFIIKGGFKYMTSTGDPSSMAGAKKTILNAIIGLVIALASAMIVNAIAGIF